MPAVLRYLDLEAGGSESTQSGSLVGEGLRVGELTMSLKVWGCQAKRRERVGGSAETQQSSPQGAEPGPVLQAPGRESTPAPNRPACMAGSSLWEPEGGTAAGHKEELPEVGAAWLWERNQHIRQP